MRLRSTPCAAASVLVAALSWAACSSNGTGGSAVVDAGRDTSVVDAPVISFDSSDCNPCFESCSCTPSDEFTAPGACKTYVCPQTGRWGPVECLGLGCPESSPTDDGSAVDATSDAHTDATSDAPADVASDAPADVAVDAQRD
jgi:hypothetical protein